MRVNLILIPNPTRLNHNQEDGYMTKHSKTFRKRRNSIARKVNKLSMDLRRISRYIKNF